MIEAKLKKTDIGEIPEDWEVHGVDADELVAKLNAHLADK